MRVSFSQKEVSALIISALVLGFVFGFDDGRQTFDLVSWLSNLMLLAALSLLSLVIFSGAQKWTATRYGSVVDYGIWRARRFGFVKSMYLHKRGESRQKGSPIAWVPLGVILPLLISFLSEGKVFFAVTGMIVLSSTAAHRLGKQFVNLTEFETSKIAIAGPLACIVFALLLSMVDQTAPLITWLIKINISIAIANMLPLPLIAGGMGFFGSKFFYVFSFVFILVASVIMWYASVLATLLLALIAAIILVAIAYHYGEVNG